MQTTTDSKSYLTDSSRYLHMIGRGNFDENILSAAISLCYEGSVFDAIENGIIALAENETNLKLKKDYIQMIRDMKESREQIIQELQEYRVGVLDIPNPSFTGIPPTKH